MLSIREGFPIARARYNWDGRREEEGLRGRLKLLNAERRAVKEAMRMQRELDRETSPTGMSGPGSPSAGAFLRRA